MRLPGRLIDADALKKELAISGSCNNCAYSSIFGCLEDIRAADVCISINEAPTVDAVPVVRCKDCIYWQDNNGGYPHLMCRWNTDETPDEDDYCSWGERRDEDDH